MERVAPRTVVRRLCGGVVRGGLCGGCAGLFWELCGVVRAGPGFVSDVAVSTTVHACKYVVFHNELYVFWSARVASVREQNLQLYCIRVDSMCLGESCPHMLPWKLISIES